MGIFSYKNVLTRYTDGFSSPLEPCEARFIMDGCALFDFFWTVEKKQSLEEQGQFLL